MQTITSSPQNPDVNPYFSTEHFRHLLREHALFCAYLDELERQDEPVAEEFLQSVKQQKDLLQAAMEDMLCLREAERDAAKSQA